MATFGDIKAKVAGRLLDPNNAAVSASEVAASINDAINYWKFRQFWFNTAYASQTLTEEDGTITLPSDFLVPATDDSGVTIEYSDQRYILNKVNQQTYNTIWRGNGYGLPQYYARVGQNFECYPLPDRAYQVNLYYLKDYPALASDSATNDFTNNADRLIYLWATANLIGELRQDEKMESYFRNAALDQWRQLTVMTDKSDASGELTIY